MLLLPRICAIAGAVVVEALVEVVITIIATTAAIRQPLQASLTTVNRCHHTAMGAVAASMAAHLRIPRIPLDHPHNNTLGGTARAVPGHTHPPPRIAVTLTQMAVGDTNRGRPRTTGEDITLGPQAEAATTGIEAGDMVVVVAAVAAAAAAAGVADTVMVDIAEGSAALRHIRAATDLALMMVATARVAEPHHEGVVEAEVIDFTAPLRPGQSLPPSTYSLSIICLYILTSRSTHIAQRNIQNRHAILCERLARVVVKIRLCGKVQLDSFSLLLDVIKSTYIGSRQLRTE